MAITQVSVRDTKTCRRISSAREVLIHAFSGEDVSDGMRCSIQILKAYGTSSSRYGGRRSPDRVRRSQEMTKRRFPGDHATRRAAPAVPQSVSSGA